MNKLLFDWSNDNAVLMLQITFFFSVMSFIMCLILFYKRHKDEVSRRIPSHHPFDENGEVVGQATEFPDDENSHVTSLKPTSTPYCIVIKNNTNELKRCNLFGFGSNIFRKNFGSDEGVEVKMLVSNIDYLFMLIQSAFQPFETALIRLSSKNLKQLTEIITITSKDANGQMCQIPLITNNYIKPDGIGMFVDEEGKELGEDDYKKLDVPYPMRIDMNTDLDLKILPNTELHLVVFPSNKFNPSRALGRFMGVVREYSKPTVKN
jgi:hypothetical protein